MRVITGFGTAVSTFTVLGAATLTLGTGMAAATGPVPISSTLRNCDGSAVKTAVQAPRTSLGRGVVLFRSSGSSVSADINLVISNQPGMHYDVGLIQVPRPTSATCGPGDPGTTFTGVDTDPSGQAAVTITAPIQQGTTGVWVMVTSPNEHNQAPGEYYTSEFVAPV
ncbi:hypothetical protein ACLILY_07380 [Mycobacterium sp. MS3]|uniref:hypothetical protein n=1 Tax=Mycobacterium sp. MS3 TaxID=3391378 RepID=UPI0039897AD8